MSALFTPTERRELFEDIDFVRRELAALRTQREGVRLPAATRHPVVRISEVAGGRVLGPVVRLWEAAPATVSLTPRQPCPYPKLETVLKQIEGPIWSTYMPAAARLELRSETGNHKLSGLTYFDAAKQAHVIRLNVRPTLGMRQLLETGLHEVAHAVLDHVGRAHTWSLTPEDSMSMDEISALREATLARLETAAREAGRVPSPRERDTEQEAEAWMRQELPRWTYD